MEFELWWLLALPLFFGLGWLAARIDIRHLISESRNLPRSYFKGLNFLLNEEPDRAIDAFVEVVKLDPETIELHFALGNLFRRRGEIERAIRMHTSLVNRPDLNDEQRLHALYELGQDHLKAGFLDRAEEAMKKLDGTSYGARARVHLLEIYQLEKDWPRAIEIAQRIETESGESHQMALAQFHCELAVKALAQSQADEARAQVAAALKVNRKAVRAHMLLGDIEARAGAHEAAIDAWKKIESQDARFLALVAPRLIESHKALGRARQALTLLDDWLERYPSLDLLETAFALCLELDGVEAAQALARRELKRSPSILGVDKLLEAQVMSAPPEQQSDLQLMKSLVHQHSTKMSRYACENCGFKARQFFWRCPGCGGWETYPPRRAEEI
jgi:lipopolysaccharide assembly protein B